METNVTVSIKQIETWSKKQARGLMSILRVDAIVGAHKGIGPDGGQYVPYKTPGREGDPVNLTANGAMLEGMKITIRKTTGFIKPGAFYGRFQNDGTARGKRLRKKKDRGARTIGGKRVEGADIGLGHVSIPARPFMVLRPRTVKKMQRWLQFTLDRSFKAKSLREVFNTGGRF